MHRGHTWQDYPWPWVSFSRLLYNPQLGDVPGTNIENLQYVFGQSENYHPYKNNWTTIMLSFVIQTTVLYKDS